MSVGSTGQSSGPDPWVAAAGLIGGFLTGSFIAFINADLLLQDHTGRLGFIGVTLAAVGLGVALITPLVRWGWAVAAAGSLVAFGVVPRLDAATGTINTAEVSTVVLAAAVGLVLSGALLRLRAGGPVERTWILAGFAVGFITAGQAVIAPMTRLGLDPYVEAAAYVFAFAVAGYMVWTGDRPAPSDHTLTAAGVDTLIVVAFGGLATTVAVVLNGASPAVQRDSFLGATFVAVPAPAWDVYASWGIAMVTLLALTELAAVRAGTAGGRAVVVASVSALPLLTLLTLTGGLDDRALLLTVAAAVAGATVLVARYDDLLPWDALGLLVAFVGLFAPSLGSEVTLAAPVPPGGFATVIVAAGLGFALGAALTRLARGAAGRPSTAGSAWRVLGIAVAASIIAREILLPPTLIARYVADTHFPDARIWLAVAVLLSLAFFAADRIGDRRRRLSTVELVAEPPTEAEL